MKEETKDQPKDVNENHPSTVDLNEVLKNIKDPEQRAVVAHAFSAMVQRKTFSGPLPAPEDFKAYQDVLHDAPERILTMAEHQIEHRIDCEKKIIDIRARESRIGQIMAFVIALVSMGVICFLGFTGHDWLAGTITAIVVGLASVFLLKKQRDVNQEEEDN